MINITLKQNHKKYFLFQRNEYLSKKQIKVRKLLGRYLFTKVFINFFNSLSSINKKLNENFNNEFNELKKYLPNKALNILDIGAGLGVINLYLNEHYKKSVNFTLIDKNFIEKKVYYGFNDKGQAYNNFKITEDFLTSNNLDHKKLSILDADTNFSSILQYDLVISLISMGYHYPVSQYFSFFKTNTHKKTKFIFDIAKEYNNLEEIFNLFDTVKIIHESDLPRHNYIRICCTGFKN